MTDFTLAGIIDSTLREGEQTPGVSFCREQKLKIVQLIAASGVDEIEIGVATPRSPELLSLVEEAALIVRGTSRISLWSRCLTEDIQFAARCNPDTLSLCMPVSDIHLQEKLHRDRQWVLENLDRSITNALELGFATVSVGLEDATRADPDFLHQAVEVICRAGASRLRLADTVGIASPAMITRPLPPSPSESTPTTTSAWPRLMLSRPLRPVPNGLMQLCSVWESGPATAAWRNL
jgi:homocitrate synthase NifV